MSPAWIQTPVLTQMSPLADADFDVEVDMDSYNPSLQNPEYEMVDDGAAVEQEFMVDVEVLDEPLPESNADPEHHDIQPSPVPIADLALELPAEPTLIAPLWRVIYPFMPPSPKDPNYCFRVILKLHS